MDVKIKKGSNINQKIDVNEVVSNFITYYFTNLTTNQNKLYEDGIISFNTGIKYNSIYYEKGELETFLLNFYNSNININKYEYIESGSRRIDIVVHGSLNEGNFFQSFLLCNLKDNKWFIKNSIFMQ